MLSFFLKISAKLGNSILDWIRSIYFSLLGSSALAFGLKITNLEIQTAVFYGFANVCFLLGLFLSIIITNRFKKLEKRFEKENPKDIEDIEAFYIIQDSQGSKYLFQHLLLYLIPIPAFTFIVMAGCGIENKTNVNSAKVLSNESRFDTSLVQITNQNQCLKIKIDSLAMKLDSAIKKPEIEVQTIQSKTNKTD